jgi:hypothetical protein
MKDSKGAAAGGQGRADKVVAQAMLARAYMTLKGQPFNDASAKANAKSYLEKVLSYSASNGNKYWAPTITEWKKQWLTDPSIANKYQIFSIQHTLNSGNGLTGSESGTSLTQDGRVQGTTDGYTCYLPPGADVIAGDRIEYGGNVYTINGEPRVWQSPTGMVSNTQLQLERWYG